MTKAVRINDTNPCRPIATSSYKPIDEKAINFSQIIYIIGVENYF